MWDYASRLVPLSLTIKPTRWRSADSRIVKMTSVFSRSIAYIFLFYDFIIFALALALPVCARCASNRIVSGAHSAHVQTTSACFNCVFFFIRIEKPTDSASSVPTHDTRSSTRWSPHLEFVQRRRHRQQWQLKCAIFRALFRRFSLRLRWKFAFRIDDFSLQSTYLVGDVSATMPAQTPQQMSEEENGKEEEKE